MSAKLKGWCVAVYLVELQYGGPEEGGWWYDQGELYKVATLVPTEEQAFSWARKINAQLNSPSGLNHGRKPKSSVLSEGVYEAHVYENPPPSSFPEVRPHYE